MKYSSSNYYAKRIRKIDSMKIFFQSSNELLFLRERERKLFIGFSTRVYYIEIIRWRIWNARDKRKGETKR